MSHLYGDDDDVGKYVVSLFFFYTFFFFLLFIVYDLKNFTTSCVSLFIWFDAGAKLKDGVPYYIRLRGGRERCPDAGMKDER